MTTGAPLDARRGGIPSYVLMRDGICSQHEEQRAHSAPRSRVHRRATGQNLFQARAIILGELEPRESRCCRHLKL
jgi:hypothetical protein